MLSLLNLPKAAFLRVAAIEAVPWWPEAPSLQMKSPGIKVAAEMGFKAALSVRVTTTSHTYCTKSESGEWLGFYQSFKEGFFSRVCGTFI